jgi:hypothetical protein
MNVIAKASMKMSRALEEAYAKARAQQEGAA